VSFAYVVKDYAPHYQLWIGFWAGIGGFLGVGLCTLIAKYIGIIPASVIRLFVRLIPPQREAWIISLGLFCGGLALLICLFLVSYHQAMHYAEGMQARLADLKSGKIQNGDLTIEEMVYLRDKIPLTFEQILQLSSNRPKKRWQQQIRP